MAIGMRLKIGKNALLFLLASLREEQSLKRAWVQEMVRMFNQIASIAKMQSALCLV